MKKQLLQLTALVLSLAFVATLAHAYIAPTAAPGAGNTDGPLTVSVDDQVKAGGLFVGTFQARGGAAFAQNVLFNGLLGGGTVSNPAPVAFGGSSNKVDALFSGGVWLNGSLQSDTLKTGGGKKPLCADTNGTLYICGSGPGTPPALPQSVILALKFNPDGNGNATVSATLSTSIEKDVTVYVDARKGTGNAGLVAFLENFYTAHASIIPGVCPLGTSFTPMGSVLTIYAGTLSSNQLGLPPACNQTNTDLEITGYSPTSSAKGSIEIAGSNI